MIDLSQIPADRGMGRWLRSLVRIVPANAVLPIPFGLLRGARWRVGSGPRSCWLGTYELDNQKWIGQRVRRGDSVLDIGANAGFFTLLLARLVGETGRVYAFEPLPKNAAVLRSHLALNGIRNAVVCEAACAEQVGTAPFRSAGEPSSVRLADDGDLRVATTTIDVLADGLSSQRVAFVKMDIEGAESRALSGARRTLAIHRPALNVATHGWRAHEACLDLLRGLDYPELEAAIDEASGNGLIRSNGAIPPSRPCGPAAHARSELTG